MGLAAAAACGARLGAAASAVAEGDCPGSGWEWSAQKEEESVSR